MNDGVRSVERLTSEIENIELEISANKTIEENAAYAAEQSPEGKATLARVTKLLEKLNVDLILKRKALAGALRQHEKEVEEAKQRKTMRDWEAMVKNSLDALALVEAAEKSMDKSVKDYVKAMDLARKTLALIPKTDGTPHFDSPLADTKLVSIIKLELRRGGIALAAPWFGGARDIPTMSEGWIDGLGWAFKEAPPEIRLAGPWRKFFEFAPENETDAVN